MSKPGGSGKVTGPLIVRTVIDIGDIGDSSVGLVVTTIHGVCGVLSFQYATIPTCEDSRDDLDPQVTCFSQSICNHRLLYSRHLLVRVESYRLASITGDGKAAERP